MSFKPKASILCDFYKISHRPMFPPKTTFVEETWTPRATRMLDVTEVVVFGNQAFVKEWLIDYFNENFFGRPKAEIAAEYKRFIKHTLGVVSPSSAHIEQLHDLRYLPIEIKALPEGTVVSLRTPVLKISCTHEDFFWLPGYFETLMSSELWKAYTSATSAHEYRKILDIAALETVGNTDFVMFQGHDFSMRGMSGVYDAVKSGMGHLLSFVGTDTCPAIDAAEYYYGANIEKELVGTSIPASEHQIECLYADDEAYLRHLITSVHPNGPVSLVSDGRDYWDVIGRILPALKELILARTGGPIPALDRVVIRPDSGDPVLIVCGDPEGTTEIERKGTVEALWDLFGGTVTEKGYKVLDSHIGLIYGDAITRQRAKDITRKLKAKGFASTNCVLGIGSFTYQYVTRDSLGFALKTVSAIIDGVEKQVFKNPKTDDGTKKSQKGAVHVWRDSSGTVLWSDGHSIKDVFEDELMSTIYKNGEVKNLVTLDEVRKRLAASRERVFIPA